MATRFVRKGASGAGTGADWTDAYDELTTAETAAVRGDTIYVADGSYAAVTFNTAASGTDTITIKKATASDHGTETGWDAAYGDGQAIVATKMQFDTGYWVIDGQTGGGVSAWKMGFGFKISSTFARPLIELSSGANYVSVSHIELEGNNNTSGGGSIAQDAVECNGATDFTLSYFYTHDIGRAPFFLVPAPDIIIEHGCVGTFNGGVAHSEVIAAYLWTSGNLTFRYNLVLDVTSTGGIMWDNSENNASECRIYGNIFFQESGHTWVGGNGVIGGWTGGSGEEFRNCLVYNNTFIGITINVLTTAPVTYSGNVFKNNLLYNCAALNFGRFGTHTHNHYVDTTDPSETNGTTGTGDPFVDFTAYDFQTMQGTTAGDTLASPYDTDPLGDTRTLWTRGAIDSINLPAPTSLTATASGSSAIALSWTDNASDETGYIVERSFNGTTGWTTIATLAANAESYTDAGLNGETAYHYRVKATNAYGSSAYSDVATDTTDAAPVLSAGVSVGAGAMFTTF